MPSKVQFFSFLVLFLSFQATAQPPSSVMKGQWSPIFEKNGIKVYKQKLHDNPLLALRAHGKLNSSIESLLTIFRDVKGSLQWAPRLKERFILKNISESEAIVYEVRQLPWPCKNRDLVLHNKLFFDKQNKSLVLRTWSVDGFPQDPSNPEFVRADISYSAITMKPLSKETTKVEIVIHVDPRGDIPKWLVNLIQKNWPYKFLKRIESRSHVIRPQLGPELKRFVSDLYSTKPYL